MNNFESLLISKINELQADKQKLIDIMFEVALVIKDNNNLKASTNEQVADWISKQLNYCGFKTKPVGSSWGMLTKK